MNTYAEDVCPVCVRKVNDDEEGLQCDNLCNRWFHRSCAGIPKAEYAKIAGSNTNKWYCSRADCVAKAASADISSVLSTLMTKVDGLASLVNKLSDVPNDTKYIKSEIHSIQEKLNSIEPKLEEFDKRLTTLEERGISVNTLNVDNVIDELQERTVRKKNIIVFNAPESTNSQPQATKAHDTGIVTAIINCAAPGFDVPGKLKFFRLGTGSANRIRPIKLIFSSEDDMLQVLRNFSVQNLSSNDTNLKEVKLSRDRSPLELTTLKSLRIELDSRLKAGERDLTIKYRNGVPKIIKTNTLSKN